MRKENKIMATLKNYYAVAETVQRYGGRYYYAIYNDGNTYTVGDKVIVSGACDDVLEITNILTPEEISRNITAEVICKVDTSAYDARVQRCKKADKLKKEMDKMIKAMDESKKYEMYAEESPALAEKLNEYKTLV